MPTHFYITYGAFTTRVQLSCPDRDRLTQKAELIYPWPFAAWCRGVSKLRGPGRGEAVGKLKRGPLPREIRRQDGGCGKA